MSREDWKEFEDHRKDKAQKRDDRMEAAERCLTDLQTLAVNQGCQLVVAVGDRHWLLKRGRRTIVQYWPSAGKWQICKTGKKRFGSPEQFGEFIVRGTYK